MQEFDAQFYEKVTLRLGLDAFGNDFQMNRFSQRNNHSHDLRIVRILRYPLYEAPIILKNLLKSQPLYVAVLSSQTQVLIPVILDPFKASLDHAEFSLITTHRKGTHFRLEGRSLIPGEKLIITESSGPILRRHVVRADALGNLSLKIEPIVLGRLGGFASLTIQKGPLETQMTFPWGGKLEQASPRFQPLALTTKPQAIDLATLAPKIEANLHL